MIPQKRYYLSKFEGSGTFEDPYIAAVAKYGKCGMLDYRKDERMKLGWCIVCIESEQPLPISENFLFLADIDYFYLGDDLDSPLADETKNRLRLAIDLPFERTTLREIIIETQLCDTDLSASSNGIYKIYLLGEIWSGTEEEAFAFIASCICPYPLTYSEKSASSSLSTVQASTLQAIVIIKSFFDFEAPKEQQLEIVCQRAKAVENRVVKAINQVERLIESNDAKLLVAPESTWLCRFAFDLRAVESLILTKREAARLRDPNACESFKFEILVIAAYHRNGAQVNITDNSTQKSPECNVIWGDHRPVHIECKMKRPEVVKPRTAGPHLEWLADETLKHLDEIGLPCDVSVRDRFDPSNKDVELVLAWVKENLTSDCSLPMFKKIGAKRIEVYGEPIEEVGNERVLVTPRKFDFVRSECQHDSDSALRNAKCFAWKTDQKWKWINSSIRTLKDTQQLPKNEPSIMYLSVPPGPFDVVWYRIELLAQEVRTLFSHDCKRLSMVVIMGEGDRFKKGEDNDSNTVVSTTYFQAVENEHTRNPLPDDFKVFGRDFMR